MDGRWSPELSGLSKDVRGGKMLKCGVCLGICGGLVPVTQAKVTTFPVEPVTHEERKSLCSNQSEAGCELQLPKSCPS